MITFNSYGRGFSTQTGKHEAVEYIKHHIPTDARILDVGFGCAIYARLLRREGYQYIDGVDVYGNGVQELGLDRYYNHIFITDILDFDFDYYDLILMGDVLEHLHLQDARGLLEGWISDRKTRHLMVSVPYMYPQKATENPKEEHLQDTITGEYMAIHYPYLKLLYTHEMSDVPGYQIALYTWTRIE